MADAEGDRPLVQLDVEAGIGIITIDNPPVNALVPDVRDGIVDALERGEANAGRKRAIAYSDADIHRLRFVRRARDLVFSVDQVRAASALERSEAQSRPCQVTCT